MKAKKSEDISTKVLTNEKDISALSGQLYLKCDKEDLIKVDKRFQSFITHDDFDLLLKKLTSYVSIDQINDLDLKIELLKTELKS